MAAAAAARSQPICFRLTTRDFIVLTLRWTWINGRLYWRCGGCTVHLLSLWRCSCLILSRLAYYILYQPWQICLLYLNIKLPNIRTWRFMLEQLRGFEYSNGLVLISCMVNFTYSNGKKIDIENNRHRDYSCHNQSKPTAIFFSTSCQH